MKDTARTGGAYGLGLIPTDVHGYESGPYTQAINLNCDSAWGHGGTVPGYYQLPVSSPDGSRQVVLLVNADPSLMQDRLSRIYDFLDTAYCRGVPSA
jgi:hypothetical protein